MSANDNGHETLRIEARAWLIKLHSGEPSGELLADFERWRAESLSNRVAYDREVADYGLMSSIKTSEEFGIDGDWRKIPVRRSLKFGTLAAAVIALLFVVMAGTRNHIADPQLKPTVSYAFETFSTRRGEIRVFYLSDGSVATLDTDSKVEVSITDKRRLLRLAQGRARFNVAAGKVPFTVQAGAGEVVVKSGTFDMAFVAQDRVSIQLLDGSAIVRPKLQYASLNTSPGELQPGTSFTYQGDSFLKTTKAAFQPGRDTHWPAGWVEYETVRLDTLISQANGYTTKPIRLADPTLGSLKVSGRFRISDTNGFVLRICELFGLRAVAEQEATYLRKP